MRLLVTGGAGYIGSHTIIELVKNNHDVLIVDNLVNSSLRSIQRIEKILGKHIPFYKVDCTDRDALTKVFDHNGIEAVLHFAGLKSVSESVEQPLHYYQQNIDSMHVLYEVMRIKGVRRIIFSSSATVYGDPLELPLHEDSPVNAPTNPYGRTKSMIEQIFHDLAATDPQAGSNNFTLL